MVGWCFWESSLIKRLPWTLCLPPYPSLYFLPQIWNTRCPGHVMTDWLERQKEPRPWCHCGTVIAIQEFVTPNLPLHKKKKTPILYFGFFVLVVKCNFFMIWLFFKNVSSEGVKGFVVIRCRQRVQGGCLGLGFPRSCLWNMDSSARNLFGRESKEIP